MTIRDIERSWLESETGILRTLRAAVDRLEQHVVPLVPMPTEVDMESAGSGVLATINGRYYLVSAAHVLDHCEAGVFVPMANGRIEPLANDIILSGKPPDGNRENDRIDI